MSGVPLFEQGDARDALKSRCRERKIPISVLDDLISAELEQLGKLRKRGLREKFDEILRDGFSDIERGE
jgi:hypothetical protein